VPVPAPSVAARCTVRECGATRAMAPMDRKTISFTINATHFDLADVTRHANPDVIAAIMDTAKPTQHAVVEVWVSHFVSKNAAIRFPWLNIATTDFKSAAVVFEIQPEDVDDVDFVQINLFYDNCHDDMCISETSPHLNKVGNIHIPISEFGTAQTIGTHFFNPLRTPTPFDLCIDVHAPPVPLNLKPNKTVERTCTPAMQRSMQQSLAGLAALDFSAQPLMREFFSQGQDDSVWTTLVSGQNVQLTHDWIKHRFELAAKYINTTLAVVVDTINEFARYPLPDVPLGLALRMRDIFVWYTFGVTINQGTEYTPDLAWVACIDNATGRRMAFVQTCDQEQFVADTKKSDCETLAALIVSCHHALRRYPNLELDPTIDAIQWFANTRLAAVTFGIAKTGRVQAFEDVHGLIAQSHQSSSVLVTDANFKNESVAGHATAVFLCGLTTGMYNSSYDEQTNIVSTVAVGHAERAAHLISGCMSRLRTEAHARECSTQPFTPKAVTDHHRPTSMALLEAKFSCIHNRVMFAEGTSQVDPLVGSAHGRMQDRLKELILRTVHAAAESGDTAATKAVVAAVNKFGSMSSTHSYELISCDPSSEAYQTQKAFLLAFAIAYADVACCLGIEDEFGNFTPGLNPYRANHGKVSMINLAGPAECDVVKACERTARDSARPPYTIRVSTRTPPPVPHAIAEFCRRVNASGRGKPRGGVAHAFPNHPFFHSVGSRGAAAAFLDAIAPEIVFAEAEVVSIYNENFFVWFRLTLRPPSAALEGGMFTNATGSVRSTHTERAQEDVFMEADFTCPLRTQDTPPLKFRDQYRQRVASYGTDAD
jgi:hypothetical protein